MARIWALLGPEKPRESLVRRRESFVPGQGGGQNAGLGSQGEVMGGEQSHTPRDPQGVGGLQRGLRDRLLRLRRRRLVLRPRADACSTTDTSTNADARSTTDTGMERVCIQAPVLDSTRL